MSLAFLGNTVILWGSMRYNTIELDKVTLVFIGKNHFLAICRKPSISNATLFSTFIRDYFLKVVVRFLKHDITSITSTSESLAITDLIIAIIFGIPIATVLFSEDWSLGATLCYFQG